MWGNEPWTPGEKLILRLLAVLSAALLLWGMYESRNTCGPNYDRPCAYSEDAP
jgi:hypothetical protein